MENTGSSKVEFSAKDSGKSLASVIEATRVPSGCRGGGKDGGKVLKYFGKVPEVTRKVRNGKILTLHVPESFKSAEK